MLTSGMNCLQNRQDTFHKWFHKSPDALALAGAGFYYTGDPAEDDDTVTCFCCNKELSGWESGDDPLNEHLAHPKTKAGCAWALLMNEKRNPTIPPDHSTLLKAREISFKGWPHEKERGWIGKAKKVDSLLPRRDSWIDVLQMAKAGFHFAPSAESIDAAECIYCKLSLDGWERSDDPIVEHEKRARGLDCAFFNGLSTIGAASSIFALTKNAFATEKATQELSRVESVKSSQNATSLVDSSAELVTKPATKRKQTAKRKLPISKTKQAIDLGDQTDEEKMITEPLPIILKSARKKRGSEETASIFSEDVYESPVETLTPSKKPRLRRNRSTSATGLNRYAEQSISPPTNKARKTSTASKIRKARTPFEDVDANILNTDAAVFTQKKIIKEEPFEEESGLPSIETESSPTAIMKTKAEDNKGQKRPRGRHAPTTQAHRATRSSSAYTDQRMKVPQQDTAKEEACVPSSIEGQDDIDERQQDRLQSDAVQYNDPSRNESERSASELVPTLNDAIQETLQPALKTTRRASTRRGSAKAMATQLEQVLSAPTKSQRSRKSSMSNGKLSAPTAIAANSETQKTTSGRRTSNRRRGSDNANETYLEDIVMLDHKAKLKGPRLSKSHSTQVQSEKLNIETITEVDEPIVSRLGSEPVLPTLTEDFEPESAEQNAVDVRASQKSLEQVRGTGSPFPSSRIDPEECPLPRQATELDLAAETSQAPTARADEAVQVMPEITTARAALRPVKNDEEARSSFPQLTECFDEKDYESVDSIDQSPIQGYFCGLMMSAKQCQRVRNSPESLSAAELEMSCEEFLRHRTRHAVDLLETECQKMVESLELAGQSANEVIATCV